MSPSSTQRLLKYAAERIGRDELARRLKASADELREWIEGAKMPTRKALALADLIDQLDTSRS